MPSIPCGKSVDTRSWCDIFGLTLRNSWYCKKKQLKEKSTASDASMQRQERYETIQEEFFCPEDARPGDVIGVTTEAGTTAEVVIPDGVECGEAFLANIAVPAEWAQERSLEHDEAAAMPHISPEELARRRNQEDEAYLNQLEAHEAFYVTQKRQAIANAKAEARARRASWELERCPGRCCRTVHTPKETVYALRTDDSPLSQTRCTVCGSLAPDPDDWYCLLPEAMRRNWGWSPWLHGGAKDV